MGLHSDSERGSRSGCERQSRKIPLKCRASKKASGNEAFVLIAYDRSQALLHFCGITYVHSTGRIRGPDIQKRCEVFYELTMHS